MSTATSGARRERKVRDHLIDHGWQLVARSAASKGAADLVMVHEDHGLALVQVGTGNKTLGPADRARILQLAGLCSALPILAAVTPRQPIRYWHVGPGVPSTWTEWTP